MVQELGIDPEQPDGGAEVHSTARGSSLQGVHRSGGSDPRNRERGGDHRLQDRG